MSEHDWTQPTIEEAPTSALVNVGVVGAAVEGSEWPPKGAVETPVEEAPKAEALAVPEWAQEAGDDTTYFTPAHEAPVRMDAAPVMTASGESPLRTDFEESVKFVPSAETPVNVDELPFLVPVSEVVQSDVQTFFPQTGATIRNPDGAVIFDRGVLPGPAGLSSGQPVVNTEVSFAPAQAPVRNSDGAVVLGSAVEEEEEGHWTETVSNERPSFAPAPASGPRSNDQVAGVILGGDQPQWTQPEEARRAREDARKRGKKKGRRSEVPASVSNERPNVVPQAGGPMNSDGSVRMGGQGRGVVIVDQGAVTFVRSGPAMEVSGDLRIGGGGDLSKKPREDEVAFLGQSVLSVGGTDVQTAPVGDMTKVAGQDDVTLAANAGSQTNEKAVVTETGDPTYNKDFNDVQAGAWGKPIKRNVT